MQATPTHAPARNDHVHDEIPLETAFDFLNTLELENGALVERLTTLDAAATWLAEHSIVRDSDTVNGIAQGERDRARSLQRIRTTRTALRDVAHAVAHHEAPAISAIDEVNRALRSRERVELVPAENGVRLGHSHVGDAIDDALARIADPIVREVASGHDDRFRICANDTCRWIFFDESRSGQRRWCDMATCGNRAKAKRHRARQKASTVAADAAPPVV